MKEKMIEYLAEQIGLKNAVILTNGILSLPVEGETVKEKCKTFHQSEGMGDFDPCPDCYKFIEKKCTGHGYSTRPLTLGELPERVRKMREERDKAIQLLTEFMSQVGYTPEDEHYWLHHGAQGKIANIKEFLNDALK